MASPAPPAEDRTIASRSSASRRKRVAIGLVVAVLATSTIGVARSGADPAHAESGVSVAGVKLSGKDDAAIRAELTAIQERVAHLSIPIVLAGREVRFEPAAAGFSVSMDETTHAVLEAGRPAGFGDKLRNLFGRNVAVPIVAKFDEDALEEIVTDTEAKLIDDPPQEGAISFEGLEPKAVAPRPGHRVRRDALKTALRNAVATGSIAAIDLPIETETPKLDEAGVAAAVEEARVLTSAPISLSRQPTQEELDEFERADAARQRQIDEQAAFAPKKRKHKKKGSDDVMPPKAPPPIPKPHTIELTLSREDLVAATRATIEGAPAHLAVGLDRADLERRLQAVSSELADSARDARFEIDEKDHVTIVPSRTGTRVDPAKVIEALVAASKRRDRKGDLPVDHGVEPTLTTAAAENLHIKGLVTSFTTRHPCCQPRVINIHRISDLMDGVIVKPGDTFSVNKFVGPRTIERGFVVAPSIGDGEMVDTVGGGISQFATTLFNALFDGGYVIKERKAHSFYFTRYPMGIEATLSDPSPDLVFYNDTEAGILVKVRYDRTSVTVKLYGDNGGRKVDRHVSQVFDVTDPKTEYEANDALEPDEEKVVDKGTNGWSVWAERTIHFPNGEHREEKRKVTYNPRPRLVRVHSCNIPKGEPGFTGLPCPKKTEPDDTESTTSVSTGGFDPQAVDPTAPL